MINIRIVNLLLDRGVCWSNLIVTMCVPMCWVLWTCCVHYLHLTRMLRGDSHTWRWWSPIGEAASATDTCLIWWPSRWRQHRWISLIHLLLWNCGQMLVLGTGGQTLSATQLIVIRADTGVCKLVKESMPPDLILGPQPECSYARKSHYSFDFAHQVLFPSDPLQPGPIYFKCTRKCRLFSVACEANRSTWCLMRASTLGKLFKPPLRNTYLMSHSADDGMAQSRCDEANIADLARSFPRQWCAVWMGLTVVACT